VTLRVRSKGRWQNWEKHFPPFSSIFDLISSIFDLNQKFRTSRLHDGPAFRGRKTTL
jgi:hypothetical protein